MANTESRKDISDEAAEYLEGIAAGIRAGEVVVTSAEHQQETIGAHTWGEGRFDIRTGRESMCLRYAWQGLSEKERQAREEKAQQASETAGGVRAGEHSSESRPPKHRSILDRIRGR